MESFYIQMGISAVLGLLTHLIPADGSSKKKWKSAMLKMFKAIAAAYPEFTDTIPATVPPTPKA